MKFLLYLIGPLLLLQQYGVECKLDTKLSQLQEKASRTFIISYHRANLSSLETQELENTIRKSCECKVEHLPFTRTFILTHDEINRIRVDRLALPSGVTLKRDRFVNITIDKQENYMNIIKLASSDVKMDPGYHLQWAFQNLSNNADINAEEAWKIYKSDSIGSKAMHPDKYPAAIVAIVDTGVDYNHPDLKDVMWTNPGEIPGNGIDDDQNGIIDDYYGADFTGVEPVGNPMDIEGHGTHCAGVVAAKAGNGEGIRGVASFVKGKVKIMAIRTIGEKSAEHQGILLSNKLKAFQYLITKGANISSHSYMVNVTLEEDYHNWLEANPNHLAVACSGNGGRVLTTENKLIPCSVKTKNMLCVASSTDENTRSSFSNIGKDYVDVFAPGSNILSTYLNADYKYMWGTSMATPHVSGLAALVKSMRKTFDGEEVKQLIVKNVKKMEHYKHVVSSEGLIDMAKTISATRKLKNKK